MDCLTPKRGGFQHCSLAEAKCQRYGLLPSWRCSSHRGRAEKRMETGMTDPGCPRNRRPCQSPSTFTPRQGIPSRAFPDLQQSRPVSELDVKLFAVHSPAACVSIISRINRARDRHHSVSHTAENLRLRMLSGETMEPAAALGCAKHIFLRLGRMANYRAVD